MHFERLLGPILFTLLSAACSAVVADPPARPTEASDQTECARCDGDWGIHGLSQTPGCNCRTTDFGESCTASNQCRGVCLVDGSKTIEVEQGSPSRGYFEGECAEFVTSYGCHSVAPPEPTLLNLDEPPPTYCFD